MLGHSSATMTLDTYRHLFEDRLDEVGDRMDAAREAAQARRSALRGVAPPDRAAARALPSPDPDGSKKGS